MSQPRNSVRSVVGRPRGRPPNGARRSSRRGSGRRGVVPVPRPLAQPAPNPIQAPQVQAPAPNPARAPVPDQAPRQVPILAPRAQAPAPVAPPVQRPVTPPLQNPLQSAPMFQFSGAGAFSGGFMNKSRSGSNSNSNAGGPRNRLSYRVPPSRQLPAPVPCRSIQVGRRPPHIPPRIPHPPRIPEASNSSGGHGPGLPDFQILRDLIRPIVERLGRAVPDQVPQMVPQIFSRSSSSSGGAPQSNLPMLAPPSGQAPSSGSNSAQPQDSGSQSAPSLSSQKAQQPASQSAPAQSGPAQSGPAQPDPNAMDLDNDPPPDNSDGYSIGRVKAILEAMIGAQDPERAVDSAAWILRAFRVQDLILVACRPNQKFNFCRCGLDVKEVKKMKKMLLRPTPCTQACTEKLQQVTMQNIIDNARIQAAISQGNSASQQQFDECLVFLEQQNGRRATELQAILTQGKAEFDQLLVNQQQFSDDATAAFQNFQNEGEAYKAHLDTQFQVCAANFIAGIHADAENNRQQDRRDAEHIVNQFLSNHHNQVQNEKAIRENQVNAHCQSVQAQAQQDVFQANQQRDAALAQNQQLQSSVQALQARNQARGSGLSARRVSVVAISPKRVKPPRQLSAAAASIEQFSPKQLPASGDDVKASKSSAPNSPPLNQSKQEMSSSKSSSLNSPKSSGSNAPKAVSWKILRKSSKSSNPNRASKSLASNPPKSADDHKHDQDRDEKRQASNGRQPKKSPLRRSSRLARQKRSRSKSLDSPLRRSPRLDRMKRSRSSGISLRPPNPKRLSKAPVRKGRGFKSRSSSSFVSSSSREDRKPAQQRPAKRQRSTSVSPRSSKPAQRPRILRSCQISPRSRAQYARRDREYAAKYNLDSISKVSDDQDRYDFNDATLTWDDNYATPPRQSSKKQKSSSSREIEQPQSPERQPSASPWGPRSPTPPPPQKLPADPKGEKDSSSSSH